MLTKNKYEIFKSRLNQELATLIAIEDEFKSLGLIEADKFTGKVAGDISVLNPLIKRGIASMLAETYSCMEKGLLFIAEYIDEVIPQGSNWHSELLKQMDIDIKSVRPRVISDTTFKQLNELRSFRHIHRNIYGAHLHIERLFEILEFIPELLESFDADIKLFLETMDELFK